MERMRTMGRRGIARLKDDIRFVDQIGMGVGYLDISKRSCMTRGSNCSKSCTITTRRVWSSEPDNDWFRANIVKYPVHLTSRFTKCIKPYLK